MLKDKINELIKSNKYVISWAIGFLSVIFFLCGEFEISVNILFLTTYAFAFTLMLDVLMIYTATYNKYNSYIVALPITSVVGILSYVIAKHYLGIILGVDPSFASGTLSVLTLYHTLLLIIFPLSVLFVLVSAASIFLPVISLFSPRLTLKIENKNIISRYVGALCVTIIGIFYGPFSTNYNIIVTSLLDYADFQPSYSCPKANGEKVFMIDNDYALIKQPKSFDVPSYVKIKCK